MNAEPAIYGLMAAFNDEASLLSAARNVYAEGYRSTDAYSPFPIDGLADALGRKPASVAFLFLIGGVGGCFGGFLLQWFAMARSYPLDVGGRPLNSWPMFIPITFELTILGAALAGFFGTLFLNKSLELYHPVFNVGEFRRHASKDGFFLCIESADPKFELAKTRDFLQSLRPQWVQEVQA